MSRRRKDPFIEEWKDELEAVPNYELEPLEAAECIDDIWIDFKKALIKKSIGMISLDIMCGTLAFVLTMYTTIFVEQYRTIMATFFSFIAIICFGLIIWIIINNYQRISVKRDEVKEILISCPEEF